MRSICALSKSRWSLAKGNVPVLAGAGGYNTAEVIALARELADIGADGILSVTPYYNKPTQEGLFQHFKAIAEAIALPIILYSVQGRTGVNVEPATVRRLSRRSKISWASRKLPATSRKWPRF